MQAKISKRVVDAAIGAGSDCWVWDTEVKGFGLRVRSEGRTVYVLEYRPGAGGRSAPKKRYTIGTHGSPWTPDTARDEALRLLGLVKAGQDPATERTERRRRGGDTVREVSITFIDKYAKAKQRSWRETERVFKSHINPEIGAKHIGDVSKRDITRLLDVVSERGPIIANKVLAFARRFFNWCYERGYVAENPCAGLKPPSAPRERDRTLEDDELAEIWRAAETVGHPWRPLVHLLALTAQRRSEVAGMKWSELDIDKALWTIPAERAKNKEAHEVPLSGSAVAILKGINRVDKCPYVFTTTGETAISGFSKAKRSIDAAVLKVRRAAALEAGEELDDVQPMPHWTFHDLRRTATTGMARLGIAPHVADAVLNHKQGTIRGVAKVYNRYAYLDERRRALDAWDRHVLGLLNPADRTNVVAMQRSAA